MDPLLFGMSADVVGEVLGTIVVLSLLVERFLAPFFEWRVILSKIQSKGIKEPIAFLVSLAVAYAYKFDAMAILFKEEKTSWLGFVLTAGIIAGGSKGSIKLFRDYLGWKSGAQKEVDEAKEGKSAETGKEGADETSKE
jgi:hypothetical protein